MSVFPRDVKDQVVEFPNRFKIDGVGGHTIEPDFGVVSESGTLINKAYLQPIEEGLDHIFKVGNIRPTIRTDLGADWLLCNGAEFSKTDYPVLASLLPPIVKESAFQTSTVMDAFSSGVSSCKVVHGGGNYAALSGTNLYYCATLTGVWSSVALGASYTGLYHADGLWIAYSLTAMAWASSITGTWTVNNNAPANIREIKYDADYDIWICRTSTGVYYAADPTGSWTLSLTVNNTSNNDCIAFGNGQTVNLTASAIYYTEDVSGSWTTYAYANNNFKEICYDDVSGYWAALYVSSNTRRIYYTATLGTAWTQGLSTTMASSNLDLFVLDGTWIMTRSGGAVTVYSTRDITLPLASWNTSSIFANDYDANFSVEDDKVIAVIYDSSLSGSGKLRYQHLYVLPEIADADAYNYIKAL